MIQLIALHCLKSSRAAWIPCLRDLNLNHYAGTPQWWMGCTSRAWASSKLSEATNSRGRLLSGWFPIVSEGLWLTSWEAEDAWQERDDGLPPHISPLSDTLAIFLWHKRESLEDKTVICHGACAFCGSQPRRASKAPLFGSEAFQKLGSKQYKALQPWAMLVCSIYYHGYGFHPDLIAIGRILLYTMHIVYGTFIYTYVFNII